MPDLDTEAVEHVLDGTTGKEKPANDSAPKRRGRPPLSPEEKEARRLEREANKAAGVSTPRGRRTGPQDLPQIEESLTALLTMVGVGLGMMPRYQADSAIIVSQAQPYAHAWCELAKTDKRVYKALKAMCTGGAWTGVIIGTAQIAVPIAANHGLLPAYVGSFFGAPEEAEIVSLFGQNGDSADGA